MPKKAKLDELKRKMPEAEMPEEEMDLGMVDFEEEAPMEEEAMVDYSDYSDEELMAAIEEAKSRGLLESEEDAEEEPMELEEPAEDEEYA